MNTQRSLRLQRAAERLCALHPRVLFEMMAEIELVEGIDVLDRAEAFASVDPDVLRAIGGDRFPPSVRRVA